MSLIDFVIIVALVLIVGVALVRIHKNCQNGGQCSCCRHSGSCKKKNID